MPLVIVVTLLSIALTTVMHFEALRLLSAGLPALRIPPRSKVLVAIFAALFAHALEIAVYGVVFFLLIQHGEVGAFDSRTPLSLVECLYFSAETYTSLGFGDVTPEGPIRLMAGAEALNGLLLIGWSASYAHIVMERFMGPDKAERRP